MPKRILVCGGRDFSNRSLLFHVLDNFHADEPVSLLIHGAARGADTLAGQWAKARAVEVLVFPADWKRYGNKAGPLRNLQMLVHGKPDLVIAFPGSVGTADMVAKAKKKSVPVIKIEENSWWS